MKEALQELISIWKTTMQSSTILHITISIEITLFATIRSKKTKQPFKAEARILRKMSKMQVFQSNIRNFLQKYCLSFTSLWNSA